jgi:hypothetical protein
MHICKGLLFSGVLFYSAQSASFAYCHAVMEFHWPKLFSDLWPSSIWPQNSCFWLINYYEKISYLTLHKAISHSCLFGYLTPYLIAGTREKPFYFRSSWPIKNHYVEVAGQIGDSQRSLNSFGQWHAITAWPYANEADCALQVVRH